MSATHPTPGSPSEPAASAGHSDEPGDRPRSRVAESVIEAGARFEGLLTFDRAARVEGTFVGRVLGSGRFEVAAGGRVEGEVRAPIVEVRGALQGRVFAEERIIVADGGELRAQIETGGLEVGDGGRVEGPVAMTRAATSE